MRRNLISYVVPMSLHRAVSGLTTQSTPPAPCELHTPASGQSILVHRAEVQRTLKAIRANATTAKTLDHLQTFEPLTYHHSLNVAALMAALASEVRLTSTQTFDAAVVGIMHDVGKLKLQTTVLNKQQMLTPAEFNHIKTHAVHGYNLVNEMASISHEARLGCLEHHEKFDGTGYPYGLAGSKISLLGRMAALCDIYDALTAERPYKKGWKPQDALNHMHKNDHQFDGNLLETFTHMVQQKIKFA